MGAGAYRRLVSIQSQTKTSDGAGGYDVAWTELAQARASIAPVKTPSRGVEREEGGARASMPMVEIKVRFDPGLSDLLLNAAGYRIKDMDSTEFYAVNFAQDFTGKGSELTVTCTRAEPT